MVASPGPSTLHDRPLAPLKRHALFWPYMFKAVVGRLRTPHTLSLEASSEGSWRSSAHARSDLSGREHLQRQCTSCTPRLWILHALGLWQGVVRKDRHSWVQCVLGWRVVRFRFVERCLLLTSTCVVGVLIRKRQNRRREERTKKQAKDPGSWTAWTHGVGAPYFSTS